MCIKNILNSKNCITLLLFLIGVLYLKSSANGEGVKQARTFDRHQNFYLKKSEELLQSKPDSALLLLGLAEIDANKTNDEVYYFWVQIMKNRFHSAYDRVSKAQRILDKLYERPITTSDSILYGHWLNEKGHLCMDEFEWEKSLLYYLQALQIFQKYNKFLELSTVYSNLITHFVHVKDYNSALNYARKKLKYSLENNNKAHIVRCYDDMAYIAFYKAEYDTSAYYYMKAFNSSEGVSSTYKRNVFKEAAADAYVYAGQKKKGLTMLREIKPYFDTILDKPIATLFFDLNYGNALLENGLGDSGLFHLRKAEQIANEYAYTDYKGFIYEKYYLHYKRIGKANLALKYLEKKDSVEILHRTLVDEERLTKVSKMLDADIKENTIYNLKAENTETKEQITKEKYLRLFISFILFIVATIGCFVWFRSRERAKNQVWLEKQVAKRTLELREKNKEASLLLTEIHHRVKNNLQLISSFLSLQRHFTEGKNTEEIISETVRRVQCMALIHEKLYADKEVGKIPVRDFLIEIVKQLKTSMTRIGLDVKLEEYFDYCLLPADKLIPCGLITNEIVTNIFKYAFVNRAEGLISLRFEIKGKLVHYTLSDDGVGVDATFNKDSGESLGMTIIGGLVDQIDGSWTIEHLETGGTKCHISFPL